MISAKLELSANQHFVSYASRRQWEYYYWSIDALYF